MSTIETSISVNIGINTQRDDFNEIVTRIENHIEYMGGYFNNEGGDEHTYNINAGFPDYLIPAGRRYAEEIDLEADYVETDTFYMEG